MGGHVQITMKKRSDGSALGNFCRAYQGYIACCFVSFVLANRFWLLDPELQSISLKMTSLSYANPDGTYDSGHDDLYTIGFMVVSLVAIRVALKFLVFDLIASFGPCDPDKFTMQAWQFSYYLAIWVAGAVLYYESEYFLDMQKLWEQYPQNKSMSFKFKMYYLMQVAFWVQMAFVTLIEKWQNDFIQMMAHHFITIGLCSCSYFMGFLRCGHVVLVEQDFADIFLPFAKMFKYFAEAADRPLTQAAAAVCVKAKHSCVKTLMESEREMKTSKRGSKEWVACRKVKTKAIQEMINFAKESKDSHTLAADKHRQRRVAVHGTACDVLFGIFALAWIPTRHGFFFWILHSVVYDGERILAENGVLAWDPTRGLFSEPGVTLPTFTFFLVVFQGLLLMWLMDLLRAIH